MWGMEGGRTCYVEQQVKRLVAVLLREGVDGVLRCDVQLRGLAVQALELGPVVHVDGVDFVSLACA